MEGQAAFSDGSSSSLVRGEMKLEEDEEDFRSCCEDEEVWKEIEEIVKEEPKEDLDEFSVKMFFKGMSIAEDGDSGSGFSGIGVVMERIEHVPVIQNNIRRVYAFTDSELLYDQITNEEKLEVPLLIAMRQRILEHASNLEAFVLKLCPCFDLERPLRLAQVAVGVVSFPANGSESRDNCSICYHFFLSFHMNLWKMPWLKLIFSILIESTVPIRIVLSCLIIENVCQPGKVHQVSLIIPALIALYVERFFCVECGVPWHSSMSCEEYQNLPLEERDAGDITLHLLAQNKRWRRCQQCHRMIELSQGCSHMTCWCRHEFCYSCGAEYTNGQQTCQCAFWDEENSEDLVTQSAQESEQWAWETFNSLPMLMDAYSEQERSQLALIQRFLAGGFSLSDHHPYQSPPRCTDSYVDAMKDLHQVPWLERFVSVISDNYYEDYIQ
ncbi:RBR-TYPE E3 UBIQUITIN TRANSFERASE [Salix viminalis]|uniref:RBR-type E3 ubiquitin transferase n=1 Tax=Salix viminalis TaxID=40686 RepID=A0A9Q0NUT8_SALVM|nr:RBR-TYPE E3 UBIQUITIN TRANSFERASE [Salix viminalis]